MIKSIPGGVNYSHLPGTTETLFRYELWLNTCVLVRLDRILVPLSSVSRTPH